MEKELDNKAMIKKIETALSYYDMVRNSQRAYYERLREKKKADGTYKGRGRPRKIKEEVEECPYPPMPPSAPPTDPVCMPSAVPSQVVLPQILPSLPPVSQTGKRKVRQSASV